jgi:flagellar biosynthesis protein FlhA
VQTLLDTLKRDYPVLVEETLSKLASASPVQRVLQNLLRERLPIKDLVTILETLTDYWSLTKDTDVLSEYARRSLKRSITQLYADDSGVVVAFSLDPSIEALLAEGIQQSPAGFHLSLPPQIADRLLSETSAVVDRFVARGQSAIALVAPNLRLLFKRFVESRLPALVVLSFNDLLPNTKIEISDTVGPLTAAPRQSGGSPPIPAPVGTNGARQ